MYTSGYGDLDTYTGRKSRWESDKLQSFKKNFYREHPDSKARSEVGVASHLIKLIFIIVRNQSLLEIKQHVCERRKYTKALLEI